MQNKYNWVLFVRSNQCDSFQETVLQGATVEEAKAYFFDRFKDPYEDKDGFRAFSSENDGERWWEYCLTPEAATDVDTEPVRETAPVHAPRAGRPRTRKEYHQMKKTKSRPSSEP